MLNWWNNADTDIEAANIDRIPGAADRMDSKALHIRDLISALECCHHKAVRHVEIIIEAIGRGETDKTPGRSRAAGRTAAEKMWRSAADVLRAWLTGDPTRVVEHLAVGDIPADELISALGGPTDIKIWQVRRVIERIDSFIDPARPYDYLQRPDFLQYDDDLAELEFLFRTRRTIIRSTLKNAPDDRLSLAVAIDMLMPCNWNFPQNLLIVLRAIGGHLTCGEPFAACGRNITLAPIRDPMRRTVNTLHRFCGGPSDSRSIEPDILATLGTPTPAKLWLAASLAKTIESQLRL